MGYVLQAICPGCNYESGRLTVGDGIHLIAICDNCNSAVNPQTVLFRYTWLLCPNCKVRLPQSTFVDGSPIVTHSFVNPWEPGYACPRCAKANLEFKMLLQFLGLPLLHMPEEGVIVHGRISEAGELEVPNLSWMNLSETKKLHLANAPDDAQGKLMELKVTRVVKLEEVVVEFLRYLSRDDLDEAPLE